MKLSTRARYALRMMIAIAQRTKDGENVSLTSVAQQTQLSKPYLEQLAIGLKKQYLIHGSAGKGGGYLLSKPADQITLGQIVESAIGPINITVCTGDPDFCLKVDVCECRVVYQIINNRISNVLSEISLADLADRKRLEQVAEGFDVEVPWAKTGPACDAAGLL